MFKAMWKNWKSAGYWSEVVVEYSKLTGLNLEQMAKVTKTPSRPLLSEGKRYGALCEKLCQGHF